MFKKSSEQGESILQEDQNPWNIFEDFTGDSSLDKDVQNIERDQKRDIFFYLKKTSFFLKLSNLIFFTIFSFFILYAFFQNNAELKNYSYFSPICWFFLWDAIPENGSCYPLLSYLESKKWDYEKERQQQVLQVSEMIGDIYEIKNFAYSKTMNFLLDKTRNRLKPTEILSEFNDVKSKFEPIDKSKVECYNIVINDKNEFSASCDAYSSDWDTNIVELKDGAIIKSQKWWTSVSVASSFIDFLNNHPDSRFYVLDKQKVFSSETVSGKWIFTKKTSFNLKLKYSSNDTLIY